MKNTVKDAHCITISWNHEFLQYFRGVRLISAGVKYTELYHALSTDYRMVDITESQSLRNMDHRLAKLVIMPLLPDISYSRAFKENTVVFKKEHRERVIDYYYENTTLEQQCR